MPHRSDPTMKTLREASELVTGLEGGDDAVDGERITPGAT
jgi:hypothetical protein